MSLYRQLILLTLALFLLLFAGTWFAVLKSAQTFLTNQLASHAQDTATSFSLSIKPHVEVDDYATIDTMLNAIFDRGYYAKLSLNDLEGEVLLSRDREITIDDVPQWFIDMVSLESPVAEAIVMKGWTHAGLVLVKSHPGYAYQQFWNITTRISTWFAIMGVVILIAGGIGLGVLLKPLRRVEQQATALARREYRIQTKLPRTRELRRVVEQMNFLTTRIKSMFDAEVATAENLRKQAFSDEATGLGNRRYLEQQVIAQFSNDPESEGAFLLVAIHDFNQINLHQGYEAGEVVLRQVAEILTGSCDNIPRASPARLSGGGFGVFLPDTTPIDAEHVAGEITSAFNAIAERKLAGNGNIGHVGGVIFSGESTFHALLAAADNELENARQNGANEFSIKAIQEHWSNEPQGQQEWRQLLEEILRNEAVQLYHQSVVSSTDNNKLLHKEVFARILLNDGTPLNAGAFIPMAERFELASDLDQLVLNKVLTIARGADYVDAIAVNISPSSIANPEFRAWIIKCLEDLPQDAPRMFFEIIEYGATQHLDELIQLNSDMRKLGHGIGIDHFGHGFSNFGYLQSLNPVYVKIDRSHTTKLQSENNETEFFVSSLCRIAHTLDIPVILEGVESEFRFSLAGDTRIDGLQGFLIDRPSPLTIGNGVNPES